MLAVDALPPRTTIASSDSAYADALFFRRDHDLSVSLKTKERMEVQQENPEADQSCHGLAVRVYKCVVRFCRQHGGDDGGGKDGGYPNCRQIDNKHRSIDRQLKISIFLEPRCTQIKSEHKQHRNSQG